MVTAPVYSSAWADTSGVSRQFVPAAGVPAGSQNEGVVNGAEVLAVEVSNASALATSAVLLTLTMDRCCQLGICQDSEMPPPPPPPAAPSFQTRSDGGR